MNVTTQATASWIKGKIGKREITAMQKFGDIPRSFPVNDFDSNVLFSLVILLSGYEPRQLIYRRLSATAALNKG
jgi:hypothetical protein